MVIVVVEPAAQGEGSLSGARVGLSVSPLSEGGLDEAFGLAVGPRAIGFGEDVSDTPGLTEAADGAGSVGGSVVGKEAMRPSSTGSEELEGPVQEGLGILLALIAEDLDVGEAGVIVHADVHKLPAKTSPLTSSITMDAMADNSDARQLLGVHVQKISNGRILVASNWFGGFNVPPPREPMVSKNPAHCRTRNATAVSYSHPTQTHPPQLENPLDCRGGPLPRSAPRSAGAVLQAFQTL